MKRSVYILIVFLLTCLAVVALSVSLAWDASPDASVTGYKIYRGTNSGNYNYVTNVGNVTNCTIPLPMENVGYVTYFFAATAYDGSGLESDFSNEVSYTPPKPRPVPVTGLRSL